MTLVGLLPPLCDNGSLLVDGGYSRYFASVLHIITNTFALVDNLPVRWFVIHFRLRV